MCSDYSVLSISGMSNTSDSHIRKSDDQKDLITCEVILTNKNCQFPAFFTDDAAKSISLRKIKTTITPTTTMTTTTTTTEQEEDGADNDWPTTPTSLDQRIPEIGPCPPAPRRPKSKPIVRKRKHSTEFGGTIHTSNSASRLLDFSKEIELMYPPHLKVNLRRKIKKARSV